MITKIDDAVVRFCNKSLEDAEVNPYDIKLLLDEVRDIYNLNMAYVIENDDYTKKSSFVVVSDEREDWFERTTGTELNSQVYNKLRVIYDEERLNEIPFIEDLPGVVLHYALSSEGYVYGCVGMRGNEDRVWTEEEREGIKKISRAITPYICMRRYNTERHMVNMIKHVVGNYSSIYYLDLQKKQINVLRSDNEYLNDKYSTNELKNRMVTDSEIQYMLSLIKPEYYQMVTEFADLNTIAERLQGKDKLILEYEDIMYGWLRAEITPMHYETTIEEAIYTVQIIDDERRNELQEQIEKEHQLEKEKKKGKERLMASERFFEQYMEMIGSGVMAYSYPAGKLMFMNKEARRILGVDNDFSIQNSTELHRLITPMGKEDIHSLFKIKEQMKNVGDKTTFEISIKNNSGKLLRIIANTRLVEWVDGELIVIGSILDISNQYELRKEIVFERQQYRDAILNTSTFAFLFDVTEGIVTKESMLKTSDIVGNSYLYDSLPLSYDDFYAIWFEHVKPKFLRENLLSTEHLKDMAARNISAEETEYYVASIDRYFRITAYVTTREGNDHVYAFISSVDITEIRKKEILAQREIQLALDEANRANEAKTDFLSRMSHDIRTPMNAIVGMTNIAKAHIGDELRVEECLTKIISSSEHLLTLVNEVLDMRKIEAGMMQIVTEPINLAELIEGIMVMINTGVKEHEHDLTIYTDHLVHEDVMGDSLHLRQIFVNILSNAVKYTPDGGEITFSIKEYPKDESNSVYEFVIKDNGIGMSQEYLKNIFMPFTRETDSRTNKVLGTGLGMSIVKSLIDKMQGTITIESEINQGSCFTIQIPMRIQKDADVEDEDLKGLSILVVDDEQAVCESSCLILNEIGAQCEWVLNGPAAVDKVEKAHTDQKDYFAVIIDWKMPDMDGIQTTKEIRKKVGNEVPIIILTAYDWSDIEEEARAAGVNAFLQKPMFKKNMTKVLKQLRYKEKISDSSMLQMNGMKRYSDKRALIVEDQEINMEIAHEFLDEIGIQVEEAVNGKEAIEMLEQSSNEYYDIVFMDVQMPVMGGYEATRRIRQMEREDIRQIPIVAMTANVFIKDVEEAKESGMNDHISKPIDVAKFSNMLKKWVK